MLKISIHLLQFHGGNWEHDLGNINPVAVHRVVEMSISFTVGATDF